MNPCPRNSRAVVAAPALLTNRPQSMPGRLPSIRTDQGRAASGVVGLGRRPLMAPACAVAARIVLVPPQMRASGSSVCIAGASAATEGKRRRTRRSGASGRSGSWKPAPRPHLVEELGCGPTSRRVPARWALIAIALDAVSLRRRAPAVILTLLSRLNVQRALQSAAGERRSFFGGRAFVLRTHAAALAIGGGTRSVVASPFSLASAPSTVSLNQKTRREPGSCSGGGQRPHLICRASHVAPQPVRAMTSRL